MNLINELYFKLFGNNRYFIEYFYIMNVNYVMLSLRILFMIFLFLLDISIFVNHSTKLPEERRDILLPLLLHPRIGLFLDLYEVLPLVNNESKFMLCNHNLIVIHLRRRSNKLRKGVGVLGRMCFLHLSLTQKGNREKGFETLHSASWLLKIGSFEKCQKSNLCFSELKYGLNLHCLNNLFRKSQIKHVLK
jgi:hypothetical protein